MTAQGLEVHAEKLVVELRDGDVVVAQRGRAGELRLLERQVGFFEGGLEVPQVRAAGG